MRIQIIKNGKYYISKADYTEHNGKVVPKYELTTDIEKAQHFKWLEACKWLSHFNNTNQFKIERRE